ncbi:MAG: diacylglycerol kinase family protein [Anaerolineales bacterium]
MKHLVIVNPVSGRGRAGQLIPQIEQEMTRAGLNFSLVRTLRPWHAAELAAQAARDGYDVVVSASGDGTANETLNGLMQARAQGFDQTALGVLAVGTGNDLAASLGIPLGLHDAVQALKRGQRKTIDIGRVTHENLPEGRFFGNCVGMGFDAAGTILSQKITYARGMLAYLIAAVQTIFTYHRAAPTVEIHMDEQVLALKSLMVSVMNGRRIGGGFWTAPKASADDGWFDLCIAQAVSQVRMFSLIPHFIKGTQDSQPEIQMERARQVVIRALEGVMPVQTDGEILCERGRELRIEILPRQLQVVGVTV